MDELPLEDGDNLFELLRFIFVIQITMNEYFVGNILTHRKNIICYQNNSR
jgi:hypothetical protein